MAGDFATGIGSVNAFNLAYNWPTPEVGPAKTLKFTTQPATGSNIVPGATIPLVAHVMDANGNSVSGVNIALSIGSNSGNSTLAVTTNPVTADANGDATFAAVSLNHVGTGYTLVATDVGIVPALAVTSNMFNIENPAPSVAKEFAPNSVAVGGTSQMTITLTNPNPFAITGDSV